MRNRSVFLLGLVTAVSMVCACSEYTPHPSGDDSNVGGSVSNQSGFAGASTDAGTGGVTLAQGGAPQASSKTYAGAAGSSWAALAGAAGSSVAGNQNQAMGGAAVAGTTLVSSAGSAISVPEPKLIVSSQTAYWQVATHTEVTSATADVTIDDLSTLQDFYGFGGTFNEKGWVYLSQLNADDRDKAIKLLFDAVDGANFVYGRIPIGANDYATKRYTLADAKDLTMASFSIEQDKNYLIPYIKAAMGVRSSIHFWGSPWTPPPWMKDNGAYDRGNMVDSADNLKAYAVYLAKFVEEYRKEGIVVEAIHPQNEPGFPQDYPSCLWTSALMTKFIGTYLGPTFAERGVTADIFLGTMSNSQTDGWILNDVTKDQTAMTYVKGYGMQWGMRDIYSSLSMKAGLPVWQTEHKCGNYPWVPGTDQTKAPNDHAYAVESWGLIRDWIKKGVNTYSAWNMVLDTNGLSLDIVRPWAQNALLTVDTTNKQLNITPAYYVFRHVSQYVDRGAKVVGTTGGDALAFKNPDGTIVAVLYNSSAAATKPIVAIGGKKVQFELPANGWATLNWTN